MVRFFSALVLTMAGLAGLVILYFAFLVLTQFPPQIVVPAVAVALFGVSLALVDKVNPGAK